MVGGVFQAPGGLAHVPAADGNVDLTADNGLDAGVCTCIVVRDGAEEIAVVGESQGGHAALGCECRHPIEVTAAIQEAVLAVAVEMDEFSGSHGRYTGGRGSELASRRETLSRAQRRVGDRGRSGQRGEWGSNPGEVRRRRK